MDTQDLQLLNAISAFGDFTAAKLAEKLGISERNVRERLKRLESEIHLHGGQIVSKPGKGYSFQITQENQFSAWLSSINKDEHSIPTTTNGRVSYILDRLLYAEGFLKLDDLCDELYISRTTMTGDMKQVKKILQQYHLTLLQRAGSGVRIHGNEFNIRNCMVYCELEKENTLDHNRWISDDRRKIVDSLSLAFKQNNLTLAKQTFMWLLTYISIATKRLHDNHYVQFTEERRQALDENTGKNIADAARMIGRDMLAWAGSEENPDEIAGLMVLIRGKGVFCVTPSDDIGTAESEPLEKTAKAMLDAIYEIHGLDYRDDPELLLSLTQHMVSFDVRMRYNLTLANPVLDQIKEEYSMAFHIAISACTVLQRIYGNPVPESEIGYFALLFALANQRRERKKVIIRTLDIGADKQAGYFALDHEENPALGFRAIRICLTRKEIFKTQLRAILRASAFGRVAVMFPMIISVQEVRDAKALLAQCRAELQAQGVAVADVEIGIMVETPAAVMIADELAEEVDFFSIGTNDLTQYTLAIDRQNPNLDSFYNPHHPAVLKMIQRTVDAGHRHSCWVGICGELGADQALTETFLRMGIDELSVSPSMILPLRKRICEMDLSKT